MFRLAPKAPAFWAAPTRIRSDTSGAFAFPGSEHRPSGPPLASQRRPNSVVARVGDWRAATTLFERAAAFFEDGRTRQRRASRGVPGSGMCETSRIAGKLYRHIPYPARPDGARCSTDGGGSSRWAVSCATENGAHPRDVPSLTNLRRRTAEVGGTLGPPIVKGGTPREARREKRTLKLVDPCDHLIGVTASSSPTRPGCLREFKVVRGRSEGWIEQGTTLGIGELWGVDRPMPRCKGWHPSDTPRLDAMSFVKYACECLTTDVVVMTFCAASDRAGAARRSPCPQVRFYFRKTGMVVGSPLALSTTEA
jgi:hypothetical protein